MNAAGMKIGLFLKYLLNLEAKINFISMSEYTNGYSGSESVKAEIIAAEKRALELWNNGDPDGFIELSSDDVVYVDPAFYNKLEGKKALEEYYNTIRGKVKIDLYKMIDPVVQISSDVAILVYDYEAHRDAQVYRMHCTEVYKSEGKQWRITHTHWSFVRS